MNEEQQPQQQEEPSLYDKILVLYPNLTSDDFRVDMNNYIMLRDDGNGVYIHYWNHPIYPRPTQEEIDSGVLANPLP